MKNRYVYTSLGLFIYILFFDANDLISQLRLQWQISETEEQIEKYHEDTKAIEERITELTTDMQSLEKFAREQYRMKRPNEEIFVILPKKEGEEKER